MDHRVLQALTPELKTIVWLTYGGFVPSVKNWNSFLRTHPNVVTIRHHYDQETLSGRFESKGLRTAVAPRVEHMGLDLCSVDRGKLIVGSFPSLKRLTIMDSSLTLYTAKFYKGLTPYYHSLTTLHVLCHPSQLAATPLETLYAKCPNLSRVDVILYSWPNNSDLGRIPGWTFPLSITDIGLRVCEFRVVGEEDAIRFVAWLAVFPGHIQRKLRPFSFWMTTTRSSS
jgi:hypothetical protein